jgi:hypothetical protein
MELRMFINSTNGYLEWSSIKKKETKVSFKLPFEEKYPQTRPQVELRFFQNTFIFED